MGCFISSVVFYTRHTSTSLIWLRAKRREAGFTFLEAVVAVGLISIGVATVLTALTKINSFASMSRNATGAYTVCQNQIDAILANGPFNPQKTNFDGTKQIPPELVLDSTRGGPLVTNNVAVYQDPITGVVVSGTLKTSVTDVSTTYYGITMYMYQATVTVTYTYLNRTYSYSMNTIRTSDI
jgi:type II secretory pathway pseudopilin PulG